MSAVIIGIGLIAFIGPELVKTIPPPAFPGNSAGTLIVLGLAIMSAGVLAAPLLLRGYGQLASSMLAPAGHADLTRRLRHLAETRDEALDTSAAEIRRIERDLHDGAQARLVAMGMTLDAAGQVIDTNPAAARALLYEARDASVKALAELRDLVRGIHPPVLADRGLTDAIRALALDRPSGSTWRATWTAACPPRSSRPPTSRSASCWPTCPSTPRPGRPGSTSGTLTGCCGSASPTTATAAPPRRTRPAAPDFAGSSGGWPRSTACSRSAARRAGPRR